MDKLVLVTPVLPEKSEAWRRFCQEIEGRRRAAYERSRRNLGIARETAWLVPTSHGTMAIIALAASDLAETWRQIGRSQRPFDRWFRRNILELHGLDLSQSVSHPSGETIFQWQLS